MPNINILSPHIADLIAAGEVVERPASVVKELIENSIDAHARNITIEIKNGGASEICITDDGAGMSPEDAGICTLRHATSKISSEQDLEAIGTLGFRGEALAAISAVSKIELVTKRDRDETGTQIFFEASDILSASEIGCNTGTRLRVSELFFNTPARQKFMKSDRAEASACIAIAQKSALAHPEVSIRFLRDGREEFFTAGDGRLDSVCYSILGREFGTTMLECKNVDEGISVRGHVCAPHGCRGNRALQFFFVNGRSIRSLALQTALENAYKNTSMVGRYPCCVLHIDIALASVDVNVHPTKAEVRFSDEKRVFSAVYCAVSSALSGEDMLKPEPEQPKISAPIIEPDTRQVAAPIPAGKFHKPLTIYPQTPVPRGGKYRILSQDEYNELFVGGGTYQPETIELPPLPKLKLNDFTSPENQNSAPKPVEIPQPKPTPAVPKIEKNWRVIGETMNTYILVECENELIFIDKHAAHERSIFDQMQARGHKFMSQSLLEPIVFRINSADDADFTKLGELGFDIEPFGNTDAIIRAIPDIISPDEAVATIEEILENPSANDMLDHIFHTMSCKAAIKAGKDSNFAELEALTDKVMRGEIKYCPHGRPISFKMSKGELDRKSCRVV